MKVSASEEPSEPLLGYAAQKHVVRTSFAARQGRGAARVDIDPAPPHAFERPGGYVYQEPVIAAPGKH